MNKPQSLALLLFIALVAASMAGCMADTDSPGDGEAQTGTVTMYVKDAATDDFSEIWVTIEQVEVHLATGSLNGTPDDDPADEVGNQSAFEDNETSNGNETTDGNESRGGWTVVVDTTRDLDLMSFSENDSKAFLGEAELQAGKYTQIRLHISQAWGIRTDDGEREEIEVVNSPVKVVKSFNIGANGTTQVVIDIDLDRSVRSQGPPHDPHGWRMTPVIGKVESNQVEDDPRQDQRDEDGDSVENGAGNQTADPSDNGSANQTGNNG